MLCTLLDWSAIAGYLALVTLVFSRAVFSCSSSGCGSKLKRAAHGHCGDEPNLSSAGLVFDILNARLIAARDRSAVAVCNCKSIVNYSLQPSYLFSILCTTTSMLSY